MKKQALIKKEVVNKETEELPTEIKYTSEDMLAAFSHGREYVEGEHDGSLDCNPSDLAPASIPFWEWLNLRNQRF